MIISPRNYVFFTIDKQFSDHLFGPSGMKFHLVLGGTPGQELLHVREYGKVVSVPRSLSPELKTKMNLQVGDKIYFHFHTVSEENRYEVNGQRVYKVHYSEVYCAIRDEQIIMLNDYVLCEPVMETEEDIKTPAGIYLKSAPEPIPLRASVTHLNEPVDGSSSELKAGDHIYYDTHSDVPITIEGHAYYRMRKQDILAKYTSTLTP